MTNDERNEHPTAARTTPQPGHTIGRALRALARTAVFALTLSIAVGCAASAQADARADYLVGLLGTSGQFRVRAQAALALSQASIGDASVTNALVRALGDEHAAVRAAAASSLGARDDATVLYALRIAATDRDPGVASAATRAVTALERGARATTAFHGLR